MRRKFAIVLTSAMMLSLAACGTQDNASGSKFKAGTYEGTAKGFGGDIKATVTLSDEIKQIGNRYYIEATATFVDTEKGDKIEVKALAREDETKKGMDLAQVTGSVSSYARKYALNGLFAIDDTKDSDATNKHDKDKPTQLEISDRWSNGKLTEKQISRLYAIAYSKGYDRDTVKHHVFKKFTKDAVNMTKEEYDIMCNGYEAM